MFPDRQTRTSARPVEVHVRAEIIHGEGFTVLRDLPDDSVDCVITDPPYNSGGRTTTERTRATAMDKYVSGDARVVEEFSDFVGESRDQRGYQVWLTMVLAEALRASKMSAPLLVFCDFRQLPTTSDAIQAAGWTWRGIIPWHKPISRPHRGGFRRACEYVLWATKGPINGDANPVYLEGLFSASQPRGKNRHHITAKPVSLMRELVKVCPPGGLIVDPFAGSGSTGVAAVAEGRQFLGVEIVDRYADVAAIRIADVLGEHQDMPKLF